MNIDESSLITQEHLLHVWRRARTCSPCWLVGENIATYNPSNIDYNLLPILPKSFPYSYDPLGRPFAFVNMYDPRCTLTRPPPGSTRGIYAVLIQLPHTSKAPWKIPIEVAAYLFNNYKSMKHHATCFNLTNGEMKIDTDTPTRTHSLTFHDVMQPAGYPTNNMYNIHSIDDWLRLCENHSGDSADILRHGKIEFRRVLPSSIVDPPYFTTIPCPRDTLQHVPFTSSTCLSSNTHALPATNVAQEVTSCVTQTPDSINARTVHDTTVTFDVDPASITDTASNPAINVQSETVQTPLYPDTMDRSNRDVTTRSPHPPSDGLPAYIASALQSHQVASTRPNATSTVTSAALCTPQSIFPIFDKDVKQEMSIADTAQPATTNITTPISSVVTQSTTTATIIDPILHQNPVPIEMRRRLTSSRSHEAYVAEIERGRSVLNTF